MEVKIEKSWASHLNNEFSQPYFVSLVDFIKKEYATKSILPKGAEIFKAFDACPFEKVKVVIFGQDPYPTKGYAHGLCFSVRPEVQPLPKSLTNIFKELHEDLGRPFPQNGSLEHWAEQGVLLLNTILTVVEGTPGSHAGKGWEQFTDKVIEVLNKERTEIVYLLWGSKAQEKRSLLNAQKNLILEAPHPSPLSAYRGFFGCKHFSKTNAYLESVGKTPIRW